MTKSLISDTTIEKMAKAHARRYDMKFTTKEDYKIGAKEMRELMLQEIVAPLDKELEFYGSKHTSLNEKMRLLNRDKGFKAYRVLKQHAERVGETK